MRVLVVGGTGVLGRPTVSLLRARGHNPVVLARHGARASVLLGPDVEVVEGDILDAGACQRAAVGCEAVLHLATAILRGPDPDRSLNDRIRTDGTANLLAAAGLVGARRYVQQSVIFLYRSSLEAWLDEESPLEPGAHLRSAAVMEEKVRGCRELEWTILRGGAFYGTGTGTTEQLLRDVQAGTVAVRPGLDGYVSLIHARDMAAAVVVAFEKAPARTIYNVVDDCPVLHGELLRYLARLVSGPPPPIVPESTSTSPRSLRVSNARIREALGWQPVFPTYREGYRAILNAEG